MGCNDLQLVNMQWLNSAGTGRNSVPAPVFGVPPPKAAVPQPGDTVLSWWWNCNFRWFRHNNNNNNNNNKRICIAQVCRMTS